MQQTPVPLAAQPEDACLLTEDVPLPDAACPREANALQRLLSQYRDELYRDPVTGVYNRRYLREVCAPQAAGRTLSVAAACVRDFAAISAQGATAVDSCLNVAAGILRTALDPAWEGAAVARWEGGVFLLAAPVPAAELLAAVNKAVDGGRKRYALSLSQRAAFTMAAVAADGEESDGWDSLCDLALDRLEAL